MSFNKKIMTGLGGVVAIAAVGAFIVSNVKEKAAGQRAADIKIGENTAARPVTLGAVQRVLATQSRNYPGIVQASAESALAFRVGGPLTEMNVELGKPVTKGTVLLQIDPRDFNDRLQSIEAQLVGAVALQKKAEQDYVRFEQLFAEKVIPQSDFDSAVSARDSANASVKVLQAERSIARHALADTTLRAPYDGTVTAQLIENHEMVKANTVVLRYHNIQQLEVTVNVPENEMVRNSLAPETEVQASFSALPGRGCVAQLKEWSSQADVLTRTYAVTFLFDAPADYTILPGMSADIAWQQSTEHEEALAVPVSALNIATDGQSFVWVYADGKAAQRTVTAGGLHGTGQILILDGLKEGEQVVVSGSRLIYAGQELKVNGQL